MGLIGGSRLAPREVAVLGAGTMGVALTCEPSGGGAPEPADMCVALTEHPEMVALPEITATCLGSEGIPPDVSVRGTVQ